MTVDPIEEALDAVTMYTFRYLVASKKAAPSDAQDAVQNLVVQILSRPAMRERLSEWKEHLGLFCKAAYWEYGQLARRAAADSQRVQRYGDANPDLQPGRFGDAESEALAHLTLFDHPRSKLLTEQQARCVRLVYELGLDANQIAARLTITPRAVRAVLSRAYDTLRGEEAVPREAVNDDRLA